MIKYPQQKPHDEKMAKFQIKSPKKSAYESSGIYIAAKSALSLDNNLTLLLLS